MPRQISPANAWVFTLNNYTEQEFEFLSSEFLSKRKEYFYIIGKEVGESGTPHLQGYLALKDKKKKFRPLPRFAVMRNNKQAVHFERAKGNRLQNHKYCSKDGNFITNIHIEENSQEYEELMRDIAKKMMTRINTLEGKIKECFDEVKVSNAEEYEVAYTLCEAYIKERDKLVEDFCLHDYDLYLD